jgi:serine/threonine protein kinase
MVRAGIGRKSPYSRSFASVQGAIPDLAVIDHTSGPVMRNRPQLMTANSLAPLCLSPNAHHLLPWSTEHLRARLSPRTSRHRTMAESTMHATEVEPTEPLLPDIPEEVVFTCHLQKPSGKGKRYNQYLRRIRIGKGHHGEVYLCEDTVRGNKEVVSQASAQPLTLSYLKTQAVKGVKRRDPRDKIKLLRKNYQDHDPVTGKTKLNTTENSIRKEIAVMKRCRHPNLVTLLEVIDDPRQEKIYLGAYRRTNASV